MSGIWKSRGSEEFPREFVPKGIDLGNWEEMEPLFEDLSKRDLSTKENLERWFKDLGELQSCIAEEGSRRYIAMTCNTGDEEVERAYLHFITEIEPRLKTCHDKLNRMFLAGQARSEIDENRYRVFSRKVENEVRLFREENVPPQTEDDRLRQEYQKTCGAMTVQFEGEEKTLPQMRKYLEETDRSVRKSAWETVADRYLQDREEIDSIYDEQIRLRNQIARNAGFPNYRDYAHQTKARFDYTPEDCYAFHEAVESEIVPLNRMLAERRKRDLGLEVLRPWDMQVDPKGRRPLRPFATGKELAEGCFRIFERLDPSLGQQFKSLAENELLDLESRKGKSPGGYQSQLEEVRYPFIFMNAAGTDRDVFTLLHEGGHAFHSFACRNETFAPYREDIPLEFCEVASMGMELMGLPFLEEFYSPEEAARSRETCLEDILKVLAWIATVDAFQHWVYLHPSHSREERGNQWLRLQGRFGVVVDWSGYEEAQRHAWHRQLHPFCVPFYYIEYGIAQLGALQLWLRASEDLSATIARYKKALALGGAKPLPELFSAAGIVFSLDRGTVAPLATNLAEELGLS
jgi:oligoendopeptidase F